MVRKLFTLLSLAAVVAAPALADGVNVKKAIRDRMTPEQLKAYEAALATRVEQRRFRSSGYSRTPADNCTATTFEIGALPFNAAGTTTGMVDDYDLPADTTPPTCVAAGTCTGAPTGTGSIYTGTGTAPDFAYRIQTDVTCTLQVNMTPTGGDDLALIVYTPQCSSNLTDCLCIDDTGVGGGAEQVTMTATAGTTYFIVIDGYSTGGTPPGPDGPFTVNITGTGCQLVPVELQHFSVE